MAALGLAACGDGECQPPRAESQRYAPAPEATADPSTWQGMQVTISDIPAGADVVAGYRTLDADNLKLATSEWKDSQPIEGADASTLALLVGNGAVQFSVFFKGETCDQAPTAVFGTMLQPRDQLVGVSPQW